MVRPKFSDKRSADCNDPSQYVLVGNQNNGEAYVGFFEQKSNIIQRVLSANAMTFCRRVGIKKLYFVPLFGAKYNAWCKLTTQSEEVDFLLSYAKEQETINAFIADGSNNLVLYTNLVFGKSSLFPANFNEPLTFSMSVDEQVKETLLHRIAAALKVTTDRLFVSKQIIPLAENFENAGDRIDQQATDYLVRGHKYLWHDYDTQTISKAAYGDAWHLFGIPVSILHRVNGNSITFEEYDAIVNAATTHLTMLEGSEAFSSIWSKIAVDASPYKPCRLQTLTDIQNIIDTAIPETMAAFSRFMPAAASK